MAKLTSGPPSTALFLQGIEKLELSKVTKPKLSAATLNVELQDYERFEACLTTQEEGKIINKKGPGHLARNTAPFESIVVENELDALHHFRLKGYCAIYYKTKIGYVVVEGTKTKESFDWSVYFDLIKPVSLRVDLYSFIDATKLNEDNALSFFIGENSQLPINNIIHRVDKWFAKEPQTKRKTS